MYLRKITLRQFLQFNGKGAINKKLIMTKSCMWINENVHTNRKLLLLQRNYSETKDSMVILNKRSGENVISYAS